MSKPTIEEIRNVFLSTSTATVGDVLRGMGNPAIVCDPEIRSVRPGWKFCGQAYTLQYRPFRKGDKSEERKIVEMPKEYGVVVLATYPSMRYQLFWGENMNMQARATGAIARVVDGLTRDIKEHIEADFPLFTRSRTSGPVWGANVPNSAAADVPVVFGGIRCDPRDIVMGDDDGIIIVPREEAEKSLPHIPWTIDYEERMSKASSKADWNARAKLIAEHNEYYERLSKL